MLYIIATPIGNLDDITLRAIKALKECDLILCEDTRESKKLLFHLEIKKKLLSYHSFNEKEREDEIIDRLKSGETLCLISDAGTPLINDPGATLIQKLLKEDLKFTALPGPCSVINALLLSGMRSERFQFMGFLPKKSGEKRSFVLKALSFHGTSLVFESPRRLLKTLKEIDEIAPQVRLAVIREMTKRYEERVSGTPKEIAQHFASKEVKGEIVLVFEKHQSEIECTLDEILALLQEELGLSLKEAIKKAAHLMGKSKREVYKYALDQSGTDGESKTDH